MEIENDDGPRERESGAERESEKEEPRRSARSKHGPPERRRERHEKKTENEGEHEEPKDMVVSYLRQVELTRREIHEAVMTRGGYDVGSIEENDNKNVNMAMDVPIEEDYEQKLAEAWDYIDGQELEPEVVKKARALEMEWYWKMNVHEKGPTEECFEETKKPPIKVKRVDRNKRDRQHMNVTSRLVTKQINTSKEQGFFAATPPREVIRMLLSATVAGNKPKVFMFKNIEAELTCTREHPVTYK